jgi:hypothetical protein
MVKTIQNIQEYDDAIKLSNKQLVVVDHFFLPGNDGAQVKTPVADLLQNAFPRISVFKCDIEQVLHAECGGIVPENTPAYKFYKNGKKVLHLTREPYDVLEAAVFKHNK